MEYNSYTLIIIGIVIAGLILLYKYQSIEGFHLKPSICKKCGSTERMTCNKCLNCGFYIGYDGSHGCVPGDEDGPFDKRHKKYWEYGWPYGYYQL